MTAPALIRRFVKAFFVISGVCWWLLVAIGIVDRGILTWEATVYLAGVAIMALIWIGPDLLRIRAGRR